MGSVNYIPTMPTSDMPLPEYPIEYAKELTAVNVPLPDPEMVFKPNQEWMMAFAWYNAFHKRKLSMGCRPCWIKVFYELKIAQINAYSIRYSKAEKATDR